MAEKNPSGEQNFPPPPPGPPPGHNGLAMNPNDHPAPDSNSELYDNTPPTHSEAQAQAQAQHQTQPPTGTTQQQTAHQVPPPDSDGAPKKAGWGQRFSAWGGKAATPFNMLANKLGSESFLPDTMDRECEKAARILRSFCKDGIYTDAQAPETVEAPTTDADGKPTTVAAKPKKNRTLLTIPSKVINRAVGLAIFTTARAGFHVSGATGSGVIVARLPDGSWSPPSGIQVHSVGAGFMIGLDIYDCVVVINTREALEAFTKTRMSLGSDLAVVAGPWGAGGSVDFAAPQSQKGKGKAGDVAESPDLTKDAEGKPVTPPPATSEKHPDNADPVPTVNEPTTDKTSAETAERPQAGKERKPSGLKQAIKQPTYSYVKSRGFYAGVQVDGTIVTERKDANAAFYGEPVGVQNILNGEAPLVPGKENWVNTVKPLFDTIKGAEGWRAQSQPGQQWANQQGPSDTYGHGNAPQQGYPTGFDPVFSSGAGENPPAKPPRPGVSGVTEGVHGLGLGGSSPAGPAPGGSTTATGAAAAFPPHAENQTPAARSKAAEAAADAEAAREQELRERQELEQASAGAVAGGAARPVSMAPPYTETAGPGEASHGDAGADQPPPAYADDGVARPGVGDSKHPGGPPS